MSKISALTELAEVPAIDDEVATRDVSDTGTVATGVTKRVSRKNFLGYTEYVALLTQSGTDAPTAVDVKNDTGVTVSYAYILTGVYTMTFSSAVLTANKTVAILQKNLQGNTAFTIAVASTSLVNIYTTTGTGTAANGVMTATPVVIRIYI